MMPYTNKYWKVMIPLLKKRLNKRYGKEYTQRLIPMADACYRDMLRRMDDIGADNPMADNIYSSFVFLALWKASDGKITTDDLREISAEVMSMPVLKLVGLLINGNKKSGMKRLRAMLEKDAAWIEEHPQYRETSWDFHFDETKHRDGFYYHFTHCPINTFARREGYLEALPAMCEVDYLTGKLMHIKLHREQTLAGGGKICDYWFVGDQMKNPK